MREDLINKPFFVLGKIFEEFSYRFYNVIDLSLPPRAIQIYPTERCNLSCKMCFLRTIDKKPKDLNFEIVKKLIKEVKFFRPLFGLSGGEPTVYKYFFETVELIRKNSLDLTIVTNGVNLGEIADYLVEMGVNKLKISIDGSTEIHNRIRGRNVFERIEEGIRKINDLKNKKKKKYPKLILHSILSRDSDIEFIIKFAMKHNFNNLVFLPVLFTDKEDFENFYKETGQKPHYWLGSNFDISEFIVDEQMIKEIMKNDFNISFSPPVHWNLKEYFGRDKDYIDSFKGKCRSVFNSVTIKPDGNLELCPDYILGNLKEERFFKLWNNNKAKFIRKLIKSNRSLSVCKGCCAYYR